MSENESERLSLSLCSKIVIRSFYFMSRICLKCLTAWFDSLILILLVPFLPCILCEVGHMGDEH